jgi:hypothetical protein
MATLIMEITVDMGTEAITGAMAAGAMVGIPAVTAVEDVAEAIAKLARS